MTKHGPDLIGAAEAAEILRCDVRTVHRWVAADRIQPFVKTPGLRGAYMFERSEVERVRAANASETSSPIGRASVAAVALLALLAGPTVSTDGHPPLAPSSTDGHRGLDLDVVSQ